MSLLSEIAKAIKTKLGGTSTNNTIPRYDGTTCTLKNSNVTISDTDVVTAGGGFVGNLTGTASNATLAESATKLETARTINGVAFDGTKNIAINAVDSTARIPVSEKGKANGVATLDENGLVPSNQLPSYVDDVLEFSTLLNLPTTGELGKIYVTQNDNKIYRWSGSTYIEISPTAGNADSATKLQTARTINGVDFDGTKNITIADSTKAPLSHNHDASNINAGTLSLDRLPTIPNTKISGLGTASTKNIGTASGNVMEVGAFGLGSIERVNYPAASLNTVVPSGLYYALESQGFPFTPDGHVLMMSYSTTWAVQIAFDYRTSKTVRRSLNNGSWTAWQDFILSHNLLTSTGTSTIYPMTQKAVTDALNTKANTNDSTTGNAGSATKLQTARTINGVAFDGTANITVADSTKAPLTGTGASGTWGINITGNAATSTTATTATNATKLNNAVEDANATANTIVKRDANGYVKGVYFHTTAADTASGASHYYVETGSDGYIRPKPLASVRGEIITKAALLSADPYYFSSGVGTSGITAATNYPIFPAGNDTLTLGVGTYRVSLTMYCSVATSTVGAALMINMRGAGTAVGTTWGMTNSSITNGGAANQSLYGATALGNTHTVTPASAVAGRVYTVYLEMVMNITTAGTIIPSYQWSATLTSGVVSLHALNNIVIDKMAETSVTTAGGWV